MTARSGIDRSIRGKKQAWNREILEVEHVQACLAYRQECRKGTTNDNNASGQRRSRRVTGHSWFFPSWRTGRPTRTRLLISPLVRKKCWLYICVETYRNAVRAPEDQQSLAETESYTDFHPSFTYPVSPYDALAYVMLTLRRRYMAKTRRFTAIKT